MNLFIKTTLPLLSLSLLGACSPPASNSKSDPNVINQNEVIAADGSNIEGIYAADMWPVNHNLHFKEIGKAAVKRQGDVFEAMINLKYAPKATELKPAIYTARRCPNLTDDINKDAYIDILEARLAIGMITIPFDSDLDSQMGGRGSYAVSGADGKYSYHQTASFERLFSDLKDADENPSDQFIKIEENDGLTFPGRIVLIQGLAQNIALPATVATTEGENAHASIPVACGVLWKVNEMPKELMDQ